MTRLFELLKDVAESGWDVTVRVVLLCLAVAAVAVAFSLVGLPTLM